MSLQLLANRDPNQLRRRLKRKHREVVLEEAKINGLELLKRHKEYRGDREIVHVAVSNNGQALEYAAPELQGDPEIVFTAVREDSNALEFASEELRGDRDIVWTAVKINGWMLEYASDELRRDGEIALEAVRNGWELGYTPNELRGNRAIVMESVKKQGVDLRYASPALQGDYEISLAAVNQAGIRALPYVSLELQGDPEIVSIAILQLDNAMHIFDVLPGLKERIAFVVQRLRHQEESGLGLERIAFEDAAAVKRYARRWERSIIERSWLVKQASLANGVPTELSKTIVFEDLGLDSEREGAIELGRLSPVVGAFAERGISWRDIESRFDLGILSVRR